MQIALAELTLPLAAQNGYHHRTELNKKVYRIGKADDANSASTEFDTTEKVRLRRD